MENKEKKLKDWIVESLDEKPIRDIAKYGIDAGWGGLTEYADTSQLYGKFKQEIWEDLVEEAKAGGFSNPLELIVAVFAKDKLDKIETADQFENLLFWHLMEKKIKEITS